MSKLKAVHAFDVYEAYTKTGNDDAAQVYLKSEADKVIADLEESHKMEVEQLRIEIANLKKACNDKDDWCRHTLKENRHHKHKRCLAMHEYCLWALEFAFRDTCIERSVEGCVRWRKWANTWLYLAEKFKEMK